MVLPQSFEGHFRLGVVRMITLGDSAEAWLLSLAAGKTTVVPLITASPKCSSSSTQLCLLCVWVRTGQDVKEWSEISITGQVTWTWEHNEQLCLPFHPGAKRRKEKKRSWLFLFFFLATQIMFIYHLNRLFKNIIQVAALPCWMASQ